MPIDIKLEDSFIDDDKKTKLKELFKIENDAEFRDMMEKITHSALSEYLEMFLGMGMPSRADEIQQHRLYFLILYYFKDIPSEADVSSHFQLTQSRSKSLIRSVMTRYHYQLENQIKRTLKKVIEDPIEDPDDPDYYRINIQSDNVIDQLNIIIETESPELDRLRKVPNTGRLYRISKESYDKLESSSRLN